jgi:Fe-S cluster assembly protein SufD
MGQERFRAGNGDIVMQTAQQTREWYRSRFRLFEKSLNGETSSPLHKRRREAIAWFEERGFPTVRDEEWRFTNVSPIAAMPFDLASSRKGSGLHRKEIQRFLFDGLHTHTMVFVNGSYSPELSAVRALPRGVELRSLADALMSGNDVVLEHILGHVPIDRNGFTALNAAFFRDGAFVSVPDGVIIHEPVHCVFIATDEGQPFLAGPRNLIVTRKDSRLSVVERCVSLSAPSYLTNAVTEFIVGENSVVEHDRLQLENTSAYHVNTTHIHQRANSNVTSNSIALGGRLVRNDLTVDLAGEGVECTLNGISVATGDQLIDNHTAIDHAAPNCASHELYKSVLDGRSRGVFNGKIIVRQDAQKTDARQTNRTLLLSDEATIDTKPQLEIFADDVRCTHGATVGQLDAEQLFYLRSRGLEEIVARDILTFAFAKDVIQRIHIAPLRERLDAMLHARLRQGRVAQQT